MARISSYPRDLDVVDQDSWIGTSVPGLQTRNFTASAVATYLNINAKVNIGGQMSFKWSDTQNGGEGTISRSAGGGSGTLISGLSTVHLSIKEINGQNVAKYLEYITTKDILLGQGDQISQFGHFTLDTYIVDPANNDYYIATLTFKGGNGNIAAQGTQYTLIQFNIDDSAGDKNFVFTQAVASNTWAIQHNLNKFPSVTSVNINNIEMYGEVVFTDVNNLTINFTSASSGKAYIN
jgi:hypothetical protein